VLGQDAALRVGVPDVQVRVVDDVDRPPANGLEVDGERRARVDCRDAQVKPGGRLHGGDEHPKVAVRRVLAPDRDGRAVRAGDRDVDARPRRQPIRRADPDRLQQPTDPVGPQERLTEEAHFELADEEGAEGDSNPQALSGPIRVPSRGTDERSGSHDRAVSTSAGARELQRRGKGIVITVVRVLRAALGLSRPTAARPKIA
jgi:hypothetical protein